MGLLHHISAASAERIRRLADANASLRSQLDEERARGHVASTATELFGRVAGALGISPEEQAEALGAASAVDPIALLVDRIEALRRPVASASGTHAARHGAGGAESAEMPEWPLQAKRAEERRRIGGTGARFCVLLWRKKGMVSMKVVGMDESLRGRGVLHVDASFRYVASMDHPWFAKGPTGVYLRGRDRSRDHSLACEVFADPGRAHAYYEEVAALLCRALAAPTPKGGAR